MTPQRAWELARKEKRSVLRPAPRCPWWPYVWSLRTALRVGADGRVPIGVQRLRVERSPGTKVVLCLHPTGHHSVLAAPPNANEKPVLLFTNRPQCSIQGLKTTRHDLRISCRGANKSGRVRASKSGIVMFEEPCGLCPPGPGVKIDLLQRRLGLCGDAT